MNKYKTGYFEIDHPILDFILNLLKLFGCGIIMMFIFCLLMILLMLPQNNCHKGNKIFNYEDMNGNIGIAYDCQYSDKGSMSGGMGSPICFADNKTIAVKWYEDKTEYGSCAKIIFDN